MMSHILDNVLHHPKGVPTSSQGCSDIIPRMFYTISMVSHIIRMMSYIIGMMSHNIGMMSYIIEMISHITGMMSHIIGQCPTSSQGCSDFIPSMYDIISMVS
jgi:hypothetical protein